jgi:hypothetical protein
MCVLWVYTDYVPSSVASCVEFHDNWPHWTDHNLYTPTTQTLLEYLIRRLRPPDDGNHLPKHVGVKFGTH